MANGYIGALLKSVERERGDSIVGYAVHTVFIIQLCRVGLLAATNGSVKLQTETAARKRQLAVRGERMAACCPVLLVVESVFQFFDLIFELLDFSFILIVLAIEPFVSPLAGFQSLSALK